MPPYFAHIYDADLELCSEETYIHKTAKRLIVQVTNDWVLGKGPAPIVTRSCQCGRAVTTTPPADTRKAVEEFAFKDRRLDVAILGDGDELLMAVEVLVTHPSDPVNGPWIEVEGQAIVREKARIWRPVNWGNLEPIEGCESCEREEEDGFEKIEPINPYFTPSDGSDLAGRIFGSGGLLSRVMEGYEERPAQRELAAAIDQAIRWNTNLLAEGPCGTGKSAAYLAVALSHAAHTGEKVIVSTANNSLLDQLYDKDAPLVVKALGKDLEVAILRGRANYLCEERLDDWLNDPNKNGDSSHPINYWAAKTKDGDLLRSNAEIEPRVKAMVCGTSDCSEDSRCSLSKEEQRPCFYMRAKKRANDADLILTNHSMLFAHHRLGATLGIPILPEARVVVCDEAHELVNYARREDQYSEGWSVRRLGLEPWEEQELWDAEQAFFDVLENATEDGGNISSPWINGQGEVQARAFLALLGVRGEEIDKAYAAEYSDAVRQHGEEEELWPRDVRATVKRARNRLKTVESMQASVTNACEMNDDPVTKSARAYWVERKGKGRERRLCLKSSAVDVSGFIGKALFSRKHVSTIVTSATLTTAGGSFDHIGAEIGFGTQATGFKGLVKQVQSPFDFTRSALVVPSRANMPVFPAGSGIKKFRSQAADMFQWIAHQTRGGILFLFASREAMNAVRGMVHPGFPYKILVQGEAPPKKLKAEFIADHDSCLFGLDTFWAGLDVPGHALRCVIVEKMPFTPPSNPFQSFRQRTLPGNEAFNYSLQHALLKVRQGTGRLIRSQADQGVVVLLDRRMVTKGYSSLIRASLPWTVFYDGIDVVQDYFRRFYSLGCPDPATQGKA